METKDQDLKAKIEKAIEELASDADIKAEVAKIEASPMTTKGHYGRYMVILTPVVSNPMMLRIFSQALIKAGANHDGVDGAILALTGVRS